MTTDRQPIARHYRSSPQPTASILSFILAIAFLIRLTIALRSGMIVEESRHTFLIDTISQMGVPILQSDVLYLIGVPVGYLFAPLAWIFEGSELVTAVRIGNALLSTVAVAVVWKLAQNLTDNHTLALATAAAMALDPFSAYWGTVATPYASMGLISSLIVYSTYRAISEPDQRVLRRLDVSNPVVWLVIWLAAGSLTHYATWLFVPGIVLVSYLRWGKAVFNPKHPVFTALEIAIVVPILVWLLGNQVGPGAESGFNPGSPTFNQIWNNIGRLLNVDFNLGLWTALYQGSTYRQLMPLVILLATGIVAGWFFWKPRAHRETGANDRILRCGVVLILVSYWAPILIIANGSLSPLLIGVLPFGYLLLFVALWLAVPVWDVDISRRRFHAAGPVIASLAILLPVVIFLIQGTRWQTAGRETEPDYFEASEYVASIKQPEQLVLTPFPAIAWVEMNDFDRVSIVPFAGPKGGSRLASETRNLSTGSLPDYFIDYWTGRPAIGTTLQLCHYLLNVTPAPILLMDIDRLSDSASFQGEFERVITDGTQVVSERDFGLQIRIPRAVAEWTPEAQQSCGLTQEVPA